jgi:hypothetical protein
MKLFRKFRTFRAMRPHERQLAGEAAMNMLAARIALAVLPFARIARWMGPFSEPGSAPAGAGPASAALVEQLRSAIAAVAPNLPFRSDCLVQALAAQAMCRRRGITSTVHMGACPAGVLREGETHAWSEASGVPLTGYPLPEGLVEVACFPN